MVDLAAYVEATLQNLDAQEREAVALLHRIAGAREVCKAMLDKAREDEPKKSDGEGEG